MTTPKVGEVWKQVDKLRGNVRHFIIESVDARCARGIRAETGLRDQYLVRHMTPENGWSLEREAPKPEPRPEAAEMKHEVGQRWVNPRGRHYTIVSIAEDGRKATVRNEQTGGLDGAVLGLMVPENGWHLVSPLPPREEELVESFKRELRGMRDGCLRFAVIHGYDDALFEAVYGPLDDDDRKTIETWRERLGANPFLTLGSREPLK